MLANLLLAKPAGRLHQALLGCVAGCLGEIQRLQQDEQRLARLQVTA